MKSSEHIQQILEKAQKHNDDRGEIAPAVQCEKKHRNQKQGRIKMRGQLKP